MKEAAIVLRPIMHNARKGPTLGRIKIVNVRYVIWRIAAKDGFVRITDSSICIEPHSWLRLNSKEPHSRPTFRS